MNPVKSTPTAFRFDPTVKQALATIADREGRSMANMLEWLIRKHCDRECLGWPPVNASTQIQATAKPAQAVKRSVKAMARQTTKKQGK